MQEPLPPLQVFAEPYGFDGELHREEPVRKTLYLNACCLPKSTFYEKTGQFRKQTP